MSERELTDIDFIEHKIDWEGWPDALEWLSGLDFGDESLNTIIEEAVQVYSHLERLRGEIESRVDELRNTDE